MNSKKCHLDSIVALLLITISALCVNSETLRRKLSHELKCSTAESDNIPSINLLHVAAEGSDDTIHYLWTTYRLPSIIIARTVHNTHLKVNCEGLRELQEGSIAFSNVPQYSSALVLNEFWDFIDYDNSADIEHASNVTSYNPGNFHWSDFNNSLSFSDDKISTSSEANGTGDIFSMGGTFKLQFSVSATETQSKEFPHLWYTGNTTEMTLYLLDLGILNIKSRFAASLTVITSADGMEKWKTDSVERMSDEYSPGVFELKSVLTPCDAGNETCKGFVSWKPVAYIGSTPTVANSSDASMSTWKVDGSYPQSVATVFFSKVHMLSTVSWNMTFGTSGDGFYGGTNYTSWSLMMGLGYPISDSLSLVAVITITVGLGAPSLIFAAGFLYIAYKKWRRDGDDLLLEG